MSSADSPPLAANQSHPFYGGAFAHIRISIPITHNIGYNASMVDLPF
jgi:hypothetical protein